MRRMGAFKHILDRKLGDGATASLVHSGGAGLRFVLDNLERARNADLLVVMAGGNDLARGASEQYLINTYEYIILRAKALGVKAVAFMSHWTRYDMSRNNIRVINKNLGKYFRGYPGAVFWQWDTRLRLTTIDGVHLKPNAYRKANFYVFAAIGWSFNHLL